MGWGWETVYLTVVIIVIQIVIRMLRLLFIRDWVFRILS